MLTKSIPTVIAIAIAMALAAAPANATHKGALHGSADSQDLQAILSVLEPKLVFVTDADFDGNLGGLAGADAKCQTAADDAGINGVFQAWLSDRFDTPTTRFITLPLGPYYKSTGEIVATSFADLIDGNILAPINISETGVEITSLVWTSTSPLGALGTFFPSTPIDTCVNWTSNLNGGEPGGLGLSNFTDGGWTESNLIFCHIFARLYCFEQ